MSIKIIFSVLLIFTITVSCNHTLKKTIQTEEIKFNDIKQVKCKKDTGQSYAFYSPISKGKSALLPVIICFDPHGIGHNPIDSLKISAEKYGYMLVGSNNSRNGANNISYIVNTLFDDVLTNCPVEKNRIYVCGFSGGARIAFSVSLAFPEIKGAICCGAGLADYNPEMLTRKLNYYGLVGNQDFNYLEVINSLKFNNPGKLNMIVESFNGKHAWPPAKLLDKAVKWMQLEAMKSSTIKKDKNLIEATYSEVLKNADELMKRKRVIEALQEYQNGKTMLDGLCSLKKFIAASDKISQSAEYKNTVNQEYKIIENEGKLKEGYYIALTSKDTVWWRKEIRELSAVAINTSDEGKMFIRVKNFISMICYSFMQQSLIKDDLKQSEKILYVYSSVDPDNPDVYYFKSLLLLKENKKTEAKKAFRKSIELGFTDFQKAKQELPQEILE